MNDVVDESGFTLIELLVVILILGIIAGIAVNSLLNNRRNANDATVESDVRNLMAQIESSLIADPNSPVLNASADQEEEFLADVVGVNTRMRLSDGVVIKSVEKVQLNGSGKLVTADPDAPVANGYRIVAYHKDGRNYGTSTPLQYDSISGKMNYGVVGGNETVGEASPLDETPDQMVRLYVSSSYGMLSSFATLAGEEFTSLYGRFPDVTAKNYNGTFAWSISSGSEQHDVPNYMVLPYRSDIVVTLERSGGNYALVGYDTTGVSQYTASSPLVYDITNPTASAAAEIAMVNDLFTKYHAELVNATMTAAEIDNMIDYYGGFDAVKSMFLTVSDTFSVGALELELEEHEGGYRFTYWHKGGLVYTQDNPYVVIVN